MKTLNRPQQPVTFIGWLKCAFFDLKCSPYGFIYVLLCFVGISCLLVLQDVMELEDRQLMLALMTEVMAPLLMGFFLNAVLMTEIETGSVVFAATRTDLRVFWLRRMGTLFLIYCLAFGSLLLVVNLTYPEIDWVPFAVSSVVTCVFFSSLISAVTFCFKEMNGGLLAGIFYWSLNFLGAKVSLRIFGPRFYVFYWWASFKFAFYPESFWINKAIQMSFALVFTLICLIMLKNNERILSSK
jgi:hypothetical protein